MRGGEGSASDEPHEAYAEAKRLDGVVSEQEGAVEAKRRPVPTNSTAKRRLWPSIN